MTWVYYIVTRKVGGRASWVAPHIEVDFYPDEAAQQQKMYEIMEQTPYEVDRCVCAYSQWDEAEELFPHEYHWGVQKLDHI